MCCLLRHCIWTYFSHSHNEMVAWTQGRSLEMATQKKDHLAIHLHLRARTKCEQLSVPLGEQDVDLRSESRFSFCLSSLMIYACVSSQMSFCTSGRKLCLFQFPASGSSQNWVSKTQPGNRLTLPRVTLSGSVPPGSCFPFSSVRCDTAYL